LALQGLVDILDNEETFEQYLQHYSKNYEALVLKSSSSSNPFTPCGA